MTKTLKIRFAFLFFLIAAGIFVRFAGLSAHFAHVDDLGVAKTIIYYKNKPVESAFENWTCVSRHWTYAPAQFLLTYLLVNPEQSYRQVLFWGRFPSFLFSILTFGLWIFFFRKYDKLKTPAVSVGLALIVFSWENIIYAKQMESYAIGVFSAIGALLLVWIQISSRITLQKRLAGAAILALLAHTQYQILFFAPAYFLTVFLYDWRHARSKKEAVANALLPGLVFTACIYPMYAAFLKRQPVTAGATWNVGPNSEFALLFDSHAGLFPNLMTAVSFFARNLFFVFAVMTAFIPEASPFAFPAALLFFAIFITGVVSLIKTPRERKKLLGIYFAGIMAVWAYFVFRGKLAFSPTRHSLILLPYFAFITAEGWMVVLKRLHGLQKWPWARYATIPLLSGIFVLFFIYYPAETLKRRDPFDEEKIAKLLTQYQADALISTGFTWHPALMPSVKKNFNYFEVENMDQVYTPKTNPPFQTLAFISHRRKLDKSLFSEMRFKINLFQRLHGQTQYSMTGSADDYKSVYAEEIESNTEIESSRRTRNGANNFYFYILRRA